METGHRYISDSYVGVVTPADTDVIAVLHIYYMHDSNILQCDTFEHDIVLFRKFVFEDLDGLAHSIVSFFTQFFIVRYDRSVGEDLTGEALLAKFAFEGFPTISLNALTFLFRSLGVEPFSEAFKMNMAHSSSTFTR